MIEFRTARGTSSSRGGVVCDQHSASVSSRATPGNCEALLALGQNQFSHTPTSSYEAEYLLVCEAEKCRNTSCVSIIEKETHKKPPQDPLEEGTLASIKTH